MNSLQVLAAGVLGGLDALVVAGPAESGWSWTPSSRVINADSKHLEERSAEFCQGLLLHELGHAAITRYHELIPASWMAIPQMALLLNAVEDGRMERWVSRMLRDGSQWIALANSELLLDSEQAQAPESMAGQFLQGLLHIQYFGHNCPTAPEVEEALVQAAPALARILECLPPICEGDHELVDASYRSHPASKVWFARDITEPPSSFEKCVRMTQSEMWCDVHAHLWPLLKSLLDTDRRAGRTTDKWVSKVLEDMGRQGQIGHAQRPSSGTIEVKVQTQEKPLFPGSGETWDKLRLSQSQAIEQLSNRLLELFSRWGRNELTRGHASGTKPDLKSVVRAQADPREWDRVWMRRQIPHRSDPCFVLLLDRSGSMQKENKALHSLEGAVVVAEACRTAGIPLEVWSFANSLSPLLSHHERLDREERKRIEGYVSSCSGGTDILSALDGLDKRMNELPWRDRILLVLSDGEVDEIEATKRRINGLQNRGIVCLGLGVGNGTKSLKSLFPGNPCGINPETIGREMCNLLSNASENLGMR